MQSKAFAEISPHPGFCHAENIQIPAFLRLWNIFPETKHYFLLRNSIFMNEIGSSRKGGWVVKKRGLFTLGGFLSQNNLSCVAVNLVVILEALWNFTNLVDYDELTVLYIFGGAMT